jgi:hypothetical protein
MSDFPKLNDDGFTVKGSPPMSTPSLTDASATEAWRQRQADVPTSDPTTYNKQQQQKAMDERKGKIIAGVQKLESDAMKLKTETKPVLVTEAMNWVELAIKSCGGESKVAFLDVSHSFIKIATRVPMTANLFQFLPEGDDNPRFHKVVTKLLLLMPFVTGVRWLPQDGGAVLMVDIK